MKLVQFELAPEEYHKVLVDRYVYINPEKIVHVQASGEYVLVCTTKDKFYVKGDLEETVAMLNIYLGGTL